MAASGSFSSWATPAVSWPTLASRSAWRSWSSNWARRSLARRMPIIRLTWPAMAWSSWRSSGRKRSAAATGGCSRSSANTSMAPCSPPSSCRSARSTCAEAANPSLWNSWPATTMRAHTRSGSWKAEGSTRTMACSSSAKVVSLRATIVAISYRQESSLLRSISFARSSSRACSCMVSPPWCCVAVVLPGPGQNRPPGKNAPFFSAAVTADWRAEGRPQAAGNR